MASVDWAKALAEVAPGEPRRALYEEYRKTPEWQRRRKDALARAGQRCQVCNGAANLNVHHRTYENLGNETAADLTVLCRKCHALFHGKAPQPKKPKRKTTTPAKPKRRRRRHKPCTVCGKRKTSQGVCRPCQRTEVTYARHRAERAESVRRLSAFFAAAEPRSFTLAELRKATDIPDGQLNGAIGSMNQRGEIERYGRGWRWVTKALELEKQLAGLV